jgi:Lon-like ATP-dependent protease
MVRTEPVPCDFVLVLAGNREDVDRIHPALRSRIRGYGYEIFTSDHMEDNPENRMKIARFVTQEIRKDGKIPEFSYEAVEQIILEAKRRAGKANRISLRLRELGGIIRAAGDVAVREGASRVSAEHVTKARELADLFQFKMIEQEMSDGLTRSSTLDGHAGNGRILFPSRVHQNKYFPLPLKVYCRKAQPGETPKLVARFLEPQDREYIYDLVKTVLLERLGIDISDFIVFSELPDSPRMTPVEDLFLPIALGIFCHLSKKPLPEDLVAVGKLRSDGSIDPVDFLGVKLDDLTSSGMKTILIPEGNRGDLPPDLRGEGEGGLRILPIGRVEAFPGLF